MEPDPRGQPHRHLPLLPGRAARHDRGRLGPHRQHLVVERPGRPAADGPLRVVQGRRDRPHQVARPRARARRASPSTPSRPGSSTRRCCATPRPRACSARASSTTRRRPRCAASAGPRTSPPPAAFLVRDEASYITGQVIGVNGGRNTVTAPRIPPLPAREWPRGDAGRARRPAPAEPPPPVPAARPDRPKGLNVLGTLAHHPDADHARSTRSTATCCSPSTLTPRQRELLVLRVAHLRQCRVRVGPARRARRRRRASPPTRSSGSPRARTPPAGRRSTRALLRAVDELVADAAVSDATWATLAAELDTQQLMDVVFTVGAYELLAMALRVLRRRARRRPRAETGFSLDEIPAIVDRRDRPEEVTTMAHFTKPAEGSWTEHYPELGTGPVSYEDSISPDALRARARRDLPPDVAERRPGRAAPTQGQLLHQGARRRPHLGRRRARHRRRGPRLPQHLPPPRQQARVERLPQRGGRAAPAASSPASTTAGATTSRATLTFVQQESEFFDLDKADYGLVPVQCEVWEGFIFVNLDPDNTDVGARRTSASSAPASRATRSAR